MESTFNRDGIPIIVAILVIASLFVAIHRTDLQQQQDEEMYDGRKDRSVFMGLIKC